MLVFHTSTRRFRLQVLDEFVSSWAFSAISSDFETIFAFGLSSLVRLALFLKLGQVDGCKLIRLSSEQFSATVWGLFPLVRKNDTIWAFE